MRCAASAPCAVIAPRRSPNHLSAHCHLNLCQLTQMRSFALEESLKFNLLPILSALPTDKFLALDDALLRGDAGARAERDRRLRCGERTLPICGCSPPRQSGAAG